MKIGAIRYAAFFIMLSLCCFLWPSRSLADEGGSFYAQGYIKTFMLAIDPPTIGGREGTGDRALDGAGNIRGRVKLFWEPDVNWFSFEAAYELIPRINMSAISGGAGGLPQPDPMTYRAYDFRQRIYPWDKSKSSTFELANNLDRFVLSFHAPFADFQIGRQPVSFGSARSINPTDVFSPFTFNELDKEERIGIDAVTVSFPLGMMSEIGIGYVFGEEFSLERSGAFALYKSYVLETDITVSSIMYQENLLFGLDIARNIGGATAWLEGAYTLNDLIGGEKGREDDYWRISVGASYNFLDGWYGMAEYHFNSVGELRARDYIDLLAKPAYRDGTVFLLGNHYLSLLTTYEFTPLLIGSLSVLSNLADPSALVVASLAYSMTENVEISAGTNIGAGKQAKQDGTLPTDLRMKSEFGLYGYLYYLAVKAYF